MSASFPPMMFSIPQLVNIVKLIIDMENAVQDIPSEHSSDQQHQSSKKTIKQRLKYKQRKKLYINHHHIHNNHNHNLAMNINDDEKNSGPPNPNKHLNEHLPENNNNNENNSHVSNHVVIANNHHSVDIEVDQVMDDEKALNIEEKEEEPNNNANKNKQLQQKMQNLDIHLQPQPPQHNHNLDHNHNHNNNDQKERDLESKQNNRNHNNNHNNNNNNNNPQNAQSNANPGIQKWISRRSKRDLLFMLASISGQAMKIYTKKEPCIASLNCRVTMDGKYLMMGSEMLHLEKCMEISLGIDVCYPDVRHIMSHLGINVSKNKRTKVQQQGYNKYPNGDLSVNFGTKHFRKNSLKSNAAQAERAFVHREEDQKCVIDSDVKWDDKQLESNLALAPSLKERYGHLAFEQHMQYQTHISAFNQRSGLPHAIQENGGIANAGANANAPQMGNNNNAVNMNNNGVNNNLNGGSNNSSPDDHYIITKNRYKYGGKSYEIKSRLIRSKHCITVHNPKTRQTYIIQLSNVNDRRMWARGLCYLKNMTPKSRNFRWTVVAYLMAKYASTLLAHTRVNVKKKVKKVESVPYAVPCYFEPFRQLYNVLNVKEATLNERRYPKKYQQMYSRRQQRSKHNNNKNGTGDIKFGEDEILYDPNKIVPLPEDEEKFYE